MNAYVRSVTPVYKTIPKMSWGDWSGVERDIASVSKQSADFIQYKLHMSLYEY